MTTQRKPAHGGNRERAAKQAAQTSISNHTTVSRKPSSGIAALLGVGRENARTAREIARTMGVSDARVITRMIEAERRGGRAICASCDSESRGYFVAESPAELEAYTKSLRRRLRNIRKTSEALERALDDWTRQLMIDGGADDGDS